MNLKRNVVLYLNKELIEKSKELGFNLSRTFENHLKQLINQLSNHQNTQNHIPTQNRASNMGLPGFEPGSIAPEATSLDQTSRQPLCCVFVGAIFISKLIEISIPQPLRSSPSTTASRRSSSYI